MKGGSCYHSNLQTDQLPAGLITHLVHAGVVGSNTAHLAYDLGVKQMSEEASVLADHLSSKAITIRRPANYLIVYDLRFEYECMKHTFELLVKY